MKNNNEQPEPANPNNQFSNSEPMTFSQKVEYVKSIEMTNETKQTAVDYLIAMKKKYGAIIIQDLEIAKEMEKEQTLKFGIKCQLDFIKSDGIKAVDDIYEQTYGGNK